MNESASGLLRLFFRPRDTMRWVLNDDPNFGVMSISVVAGITAMLRTSVLHGLHPLPGLMGFDSQIDSIITYGIGATPEWPLLISAIGIAGGLFGVLGIYLGALLLWLTGKLFGGRGMYAEVRSALAWSFVPYSWLMPLWVLAAFLEAEELRAAGFSYTSFLPPAGSPTSLWVLVALDFSLRILALVWLVLKLSVAQRFEIWKALINTAIAAALLAWMVPHFYVLGF